MANTTDPGFHLVSWRQRCVVAPFVHHGKMDQADLLFLWLTHQSTPPLSPSRDKRKESKKQNRKRPPSYFVNPRSPVSKAAPSSIEEKFQDGRHEVSLEVKAVKVARSFSGAALEKP